MAALKDLTGQTFGRLTVTSRDSSKKMVYWISKCECGEMVSVRASHISDGTTRSCGCLVLERANDLSGKVFSRLTAISRAPNAGEGVGSKAKWNCICDCGNPAIVYASALKGGNTKSCGCVKHEGSVARGKLKRTHGMTNSSEYHVWGSMLQRCENVNHKSYKDYGGRGINVCDRWHSFENFFTDMGSIPPGLSIERNDVNGNYEPSNCRWATMTEQGLNKRTNTLLTANGETKPLASWCRQYGLNKVTLMDRIERGWSPERAITTPARSYSRALA